MLLRPAYPAIGGLYTQMQTLRGLDFLICGASPKTTDYKCEDNSRMNSLIMFYDHIVYKVLHLPKYISSFKKPWSTYHESQNKDQYLIPVTK